MQITRPVRQRGSSAPGVLRPSGTPASQPEPLFGFGALVLGVVGVVGCVVGVEGVVDGFVLGAVELELPELLVDGAAELLVGSDVGVGAGVLGEDEAAVGVVPAPAAAC